MPNAPSSSCGDCPRALIDGKQMELKLHIEGLGYPDVPGVWDRQWFDSPYVNAGALTATASGMSGSPPGRSWSAVGLM